MYQMTPEELANSVISKLKNKGDFSYPIDPFKILTDSGVEIVLKDFDTLDGIIINDEDNYTIVGININTGWQKQRFTAAHEYCHFIKDLKKEEYKTDYIRCLRKSNDEIEKYANQFAGCLLMPIDDLREICNQYKDERGFVSFDNVLLIAEYFGVSFSACVFKIAYGLHMIDGDIDPSLLRERICLYGPNQKKKELIPNRVDSRLLSNMINSMSTLMISLNNYTWDKFNQNYIYYDNKLEGVNVARDDLNYILADLNFNKKDSVFYNSGEEKIIMTLGNVELQNFVKNTTEPISILKCKKMHELLFGFVPFPECIGNYRNCDAMISGALIQPVPYYEISDKIIELEKEFQCFMKEIENCSIDKYVEQVAYFVYKFIVIHPFFDGNGRISRAMLNWMLRLKKLPPIYIEDKCRDEYYSSLREIDQNENYVPFIMFIEKRMLHTMYELHKYLSIDDFEIDEKESDNNVA